MESDSGIFLMCKETLLCIGKTPLVLQSGNWKKTIASIRKIVLFLGAFFGRVLIREYIVNSSQQCPGCIALHCFKSLFNWFKMQWCCSTSKMSPKITSRQAALILFRKSENIIDGYRLVSNCCTCYFISTECSLAQVCCQNWK